MVSWIAYSRNQVGSFNSHDEPAMACMDLWSLDRHPSSSPSVHGLHLAPFNPKTPPFFMLLTRHLIFKWKLPPFFLKCTRHTISKRKLPPFFFGQGRTASLDKANSFGWSDQLQLFTPRSSAFMDAMGWWDWTATASGLHGWTHLPSSGVEQLLDSFASAGFKRHERRSLRGVEALNQIQMNQALIPCEFLKRSQLWLCVCVKNSTNGARREFVVVIWER